MGKSIFRSSATIQKYLKGQPESGLTVERFCKRHHIAISTFWNWRKRFGPDSSRNKEARFIQLLPVPVAATSSIEIRTGTFTITIPSGSNETSIKLVLSVMMNLCSNEGSSTHAA